MFTGCESDSKRAIVQWYLGESELPALGRLHLPSGGHKRELVLFDRPESSLIAIDIDAETISGKCVVSNITQVALLHKDRKHKSETWIIFESEGGDKIFVIN